MNNRKTGMVLSYTYALLSMVCGLFLSSYVLRLLGDFEYGLYKTIAAFISYLVILEFGTGTVMCRNLLVAKNASDTESPRKITATVWYISLFLSGIILLAGGIFYLNIEGIYRETIPAEHMVRAEQLFLIMLFYLLASFLSQTLSGTFLGNANYNIGNLINITKILSRTGILVVALLSLKSALVIAVADAAISLVVLAFSVIYVKRKYAFSFSLRNFDWGIVKTSLPLCFALLLQTVVSQANNNIATFIVSIKISMESVALYAIAVYVYNMFSSLTTIPISMYMPQVAKNIGQGCKGKALMETLVPSGRLIALVGGTIAFGFAAVGLQFVSIVYGEQYKTAWLIVLMLLVPMFVNMTGGSLVNVLNVLNKRQARSYLLIVTAVLNILMTLWLIDEWGVFAAAFATAGSLLIGQIFLMNIYYQWALSINVYALYARAYKGILAAQFLAMLVGGGIALLIADKYLSFFCGGTAFVVVEAVCLLWFGFNQSEKHTLYLALQKLKQL